MIRWQRDATRSRMRRAQPSRSPRAGRATPARGSGAARADPDQEAEQTAVSKSTLSRLENGQRRATLELLLPLAQVYRVPIDDLVGRRRSATLGSGSKPRRVNGRTVLPLTAPGGVQAWKILIPASQSTPMLRTHDGFEWLYVLSGRMRLVLGDQDLVLGVGEAAEFDTQAAALVRQHRGRRAEVLSIFGRPGERMLVRAHAGSGRAEAHPDPHES